MNNHKNRKNKPTINSDFTKTVFMTMDLDKKRDHFSILRLTRPSKDKFVLDIVFLICKLLSQASCTQWMKLTFLDSTNQDLCLNFISMYYICKCTLKLAYLFFCVYPVVLVFAIFQLLFFVITAIVLCAAE